MKDRQFLEKLSKVIDLIIENLNSEEIIKILTAKLALRGDGVIFRFPFRENTAWGNELIFWNHGRFYSLTITHSEYFDKYKRVQDYYEDYWFVEKFLNEKFSEVGVSGKIATEEHSIQNYCYWAIKEGKVGIQQSDRDVNGNFAYRNDIYTRQMVG